MTYTADEGFEFDGEKTVTESFTEDDDTTFAEAPVPTAAAPFKGAGTEDDPFQIATVADLQKFNELVGAADADYIAACYILMNDIDMAGESWTAPCPRGQAYDKPGSFQGVFDGDGFAIKNLAVTIVDDDYCGGLVNTADDATFANLTMEIASITAVSQTKFGGFVGSAARTVFTNCVAKGTLTATHSVGGFVSTGQHSDASYTLVFMDCVNEMNITQANGKVAGGFMAKAQGQNLTFIRCINKGNISRSNNSATVAGFVGDGSGQVEYIDCSNEGEVAAGFAQFGVVKAVGGELTCRDDELAFTTAFDGGNFADKAAIVDNVATLISNDQVVVGGTYKVMSPIATLPITLDTVGQTIAFDIALNDAFKAEITATGVGVTTGLVENVLTYTAIEAPTPSEDWPENPDDVKGTNAKTAFPSLPATFEGADAGLVAAWAKNPAKGNLAYADMATASIDAFLLDCAESEVETEAAKFKIISITQNATGDWVVKVTGEKTEGDNYTVNAKVDIVDVTTTLDAKATGATDTKGFFKAELVPFIITK